LAPIAHKTRGGQLKVLPYKFGWEFALNSGILGEEFQSPQLGALVDTHRSARWTGLREVLWRCRFDRVLGGWVRLVRTRIPADVRDKIPMPIRQIGRRLLN
jgi:hypothetical protein